MTLSYYGKVESGFHAEVIVFGGGLHIHRLPFRGYGPFTIGLDLFDSLNVTLTLKNGMEECVTEEYVSVLENILAAKVTIDDASPLLNLELIFRYITISSPLKATLPHHRRERGQPREQKE